MNFVHPTEARGRTLGSHMPLAAGEIMSGSEYAGRRRGGAARALINVASAVVLILAVALVLKWTGF